MDPKNINKKFEDELNEKTELLNTDKEYSENPEKEDDELKEWRNWALSYEDENGDVTDQ
jgi:hypothetical protein